MAPTLYMTVTSPPVRAVLITAKALGLELVEKLVDQRNGGNLTPEYLKLNPQHTVPTLVDDDGFTVWDSHAIITYLVSKYGKNDSLYPKDLKKRAIIDQRLHFDTGVAFPTGVRVLGAIFRGGKTSIDDTDIATLESIYAFLEAFLEGKQWFAGDSVTVADYSLFASISSFNVVVPIDAKKYPKVLAWLKKTEKLPEAEANKKGLTAVEEMIKSKLK